jgi:hypothetical protein
METSIKKRTTFRLDSDLLNDLRVAAKREHQSLNNFVETLLMQFMYTELNDETKEAIEEARTDKNLKKADMSSFESFVKSCSE